MSNTFGFRLGIEGEREFKSKLSEINQTMKVLGSELKVVSSEFDGQEKSVRSLSARNDVLKKTVDEQKEKVQLLAEALKNSSDSFGENDRRTREWQIKLNNATADLNKMERELSENERALVELENAEKEAAQAADKLGDEVDQTGDQAKKSGRKLVDMKNDAKDMQAGMDKAAAGIKKAALAIGAAIVAAGTSLAAMTVDAAEYADEISTANKVTGMSTESLQAYSYAVDLVDVPLNTLTKSMAKNIKSMSEAANGSKRYAEAYEKLGVEVADANGNLRNSEDVYWELIDALGKVENETERDALAMQIFGKSAQELNPLIQEGSEGIAKLTDEAKSMGAVMSDDTITGLGKFDDSMQRLKQGFEAAKRQLGTVLLPELQKAAKWGIQKLKEFTTALKDPQSETSKLVNDLKEFAKTAGTILFNALKVAADVLLFFARNIKAVLPIVGTLVTVFLTLRAACSISAAITAVQTALAALPPTASAAAVAMKGLSVAMSTNVVGIVLAAVAAVAGLVLALKGISDASKEVSPAAQRMNELKEETDALNQSYQELNQRRAESVVAAEGEFDHIEKLADELDMLADESGKVKDADKARAKFILGQLNEALGTEYELTGNQIENYKDMKQSIYDLIDAKRAQTLLEAHDEAYKTAVQGRADALELYTEQLRIVDETEEELAKTEKELADLMEAESKQSVLQSIFGGVDPSGSKKTALGNKIKDLKEELKGFRAEADKTGKTVTGYYKDIETYESASAAILSGNTKEAIKILEGRNEAFVHADSLLGQSIKEQQRILGEQYEEAESKYTSIAKRFKESVKGITQEMVDDAKELAEKAGDEYEAVGGIIPERLAYGVELKKGRFTDAIKGSVRNAVVAADRVARKGKNDVTQIGQNLIEGMSTGVMDRKSHFRKVMRDIIRAGIASAKNEAQIKSPSRKMRQEIGLQLGKGLELGISDSTPRVKAAAEAQMRAVQEVYSRKAAVPKFGDILSGVNGGLHSLSGMVSPQAAAHNSSVVNVYPRDLTPAQVDYLVSRVNFALGSQF